MYGRNLSLMFHNMTTGSMVEIKSLKDGEEV
jgi:hypothetical protein